MSNVSSDCGCGELNDVKNEEIRLLVELINKTLANADKEDKTIGTVSMLWCFLFALILLQKIYKYVIKPRLRQNADGADDARALNNIDRNTNNNVDGVARDHCLIM